MPGDVLLGDPAAGQAVVAAGRALAADRHPATGIVPLDEGPAERLRPGLVETSIDAAGPCAALLARAADLTGDGSLAELAADQVGWHLRTLCRPDGSVAQYALLGPDDGRVVEVRTGPQGLAADSTWARSQAWGLLAAALGARWLPALRTDLLDAGERMADWWVAQVRPGKIPRWDFAAPDGEPLDTSAAAIAAAALLGLAALDPSSARAGRQRAAAAATVDALCAKVTPLGPADDRPPGMLLDGCYHRRTGLAPAHELVWGSYHLLQCLLVLAGELDPTAA